MTEYVLVFLFVCGWPDTIILHDIKENKAVFTHNVDSPSVKDRVRAIIQKKPILIHYEEDRGVCTNYNKTSKKKQIKLFIEST